MIWAGRSVGTVPHMGASMQSASVCAVPSRIWAEVKSAAVINCVTYNITVQPPRGPMREFVKIQGLDPIRCDEALELIGGLYAEEETMRKAKLGGREKLAWRRDHPR